MLGSDVKTADALGPLRALPYGIASDESLCSALETFAFRASMLRPSEIAEAAIGAVLLVSCARPEWTEADCAAAVCCVLREVERVRKERRAA